MTRKYSSTSVETSLAVGLSNSGVTTTVAAGTASSLMGGQTLGAMVGGVYPDQFTIAIDPDTANEEIVFVTNVSSDTLTIVRGRAGTSAITHSGGAVVKHVLTSDDLNYYTSGVDSAATLTGTQTLTNKTLTAPVISTISNTGTVTLPTSTDTLVGRATTDTLTNKTLTSPVINTPRTTIGFNAQTGTTYTLVVADLGKIVTLSNAGAITLTVPPSVFTTGNIINIQQIGAGQVTLAQGAGVTITSTGATASAPKLRVQYSAASIICTGSNTFTVLGDIA